MGFAEDGIIFVITRLSRVPCISTFGDDWPQWRGPRRDGVWREDGIVKSLPPKLLFRWRTPIGAGYAGPAVAAGRVYVMDRVLEGGKKNPDDPFSQEPVEGFERVLCLDAGSGKILWIHKYPCKYHISYPSGPRVTPSVNILSCSTGASGFIASRTSMTCGSTSYSTSMRSTAARAAATLVAATAATG